MKARGTLIQRTLLTETSVIAHWCTREHGIIRTVAKGARRPKSPFAGRLDLFYRCELEIVTARKGDLHVLSDLQVSDPRIGLRRNYLQILAASYFVKWISLAAEEGTPLTEMADLLERALDYLSEKDVDLRAVLHFEKRLATLLGVVELGIEPNRCLARHVGRVPNHREELIDRLRGSSDSNALEP